MYEHKHKRKEGARMRIREYILSLGYTYILHIIIETTKRRCCSTTILSLHTPLVYYSFSQYYLVEWLSGSQEEAVVVSTRTTHSASFDEFYYCLKLSRTIRKKI